MLTSLRLSKLLSSSSSSLSSLSSSKRTLFLLNLSSSYSTSSSFLLSKNLLNDYLKLHDINLKGNNNQIYDPLLSFEDTPYPASIVNSLYSEGFTSPTPIQAQSWPIALAGRDLVSIARTGSGKTCAFLLPGFMKILDSTLERDPHYSYSRSRTLPKMLILAPTRELTQQISDEAVKFSKGTPIVSTVLYGGTPKGPQLRQLSRGVDVVIGTPGRCNDLVEMGALELSNVTYLVLDEADRMLDMGFEPQIRKLLDRCHRERQSLFFTATWPKEIAELSREYLNNPVNVQIGAADKLNANKAIQQTVTVVKEFEKSTHLEQLLDSLLPNDPSMKLSEKRRACPKTLIFIARKMECDALAYELRDLGYNVGTLHGDKEQSARTQIMDRYRSGDLRVLVATDVAARGIDIKDIEVVINYDFPAGKQNAVENYVHRIGRTGRGERTGRAFTFFTNDNAKAAPALVELLERSGQPVSEELKRLASDRFFSRSLPSSSSSSSSRNSSSFDPIASGGGNKRSKFTKVESDFDFFSDDEPLFQKKR